MRGAPNPKPKPKKLSDVLSKVSGISSEEIRKIAIGVTENNKLLNSCTLHDFSIKIGEGLRVKYRCSNCGGVVDGIKKKYYDLGLDHSKNNKVEHEQPNGYIKCPQCGEDCHRINCGLCGYISSVD